MQTVFLLCFICATVLLIYRNYRLLRVLRLFVRAVDQYSRDHQTFEVKTALDLLAHEEDLYFEMHRVIRSLSGMPHGRTEG